MSAELVALFAFEGHEARASLHEDGTVSVALTLAGAARSFSGERLRGRWSHGRQCVVDARAAPPWEALDPALVAAAAPPLRRAIESRIASLRAQVASIRDQIDDLLRREATCADELLVLYKRAGEASSSG